MSAQLSLSFDARTHARHTDPATSHEAAHALGFAKGQAVAILSALQAKNLSAEQVGDVLSLEPYAVRKRLADLQAAGLAMPTEVTRKTRSGRSERVWAAV